MDLYALLGVTRAASAADVERAYRRLARRYHPGINPGDRLAAQMYQQVQEAYLVLGDVDRRREYDRGQVAPQNGHRPVAFEGFDFSAAAEGPLAATFSELFADVFQQAARQATTPARGRDAAVTVQLSFAEAARGCRVPVSVTRSEPCEACSSQGYRRLRVAACPVCAGEGSRRWSRGHMVFSKTCDACGGDGQTVREVCPGCRGEGIVPRVGVVSVAVPPGLDAGGRIVVPGRGHFGARGGAPGDLYVTVDVAQHPFFRREGADLHMTLPIGIHEAAFGAVVTIAGLDGPVRLRIPPGTMSGARLVVRGEGGVKAGGTERGDIVVTAEMVLPANLDARSKELLREFGERNREDVRRGVFGGLDTQD